MAFAPIIKDRQAGAIAANLTDYRRSCAEFSWQDVERELTRGGRDCQLNIAYQCVDRHAECAATRSSGVALAEQIGRSARLYLRRLAPSDQPLRQCAARARYWQRRSGVRFGRSDSRALHCGVGDVEKWQCFLPAVFRFRPRADPSTARPSARATFSSPPRRSIPGARSPSCGQRCRT